MLGYGKSQKGIIPRIADALFYIIKRKSEDESESSYKVVSSYLEIYNEEIRDLLNPRPPDDIQEPLAPKIRIKLERQLKQLLAENKKEEADILKAKLDPAFAKVLHDAKMPRLREDPIRGVVVDCLTQFSVSSFADCEKLIDEGNSNRSIGSTALNNSSSRSHSVFSLELLAFRETRQLFTSKLQLVDLAGSEKTSDAKTSGAQLVEGININKSLSCLGSCISALAKAALKREELEASKTEAQREHEALENERARIRALMKTGKAKKKKNTAEHGKEESDEFVPYRESTLTFLLRDCLGGNSQTSLIAALSPSASSFHETLSTLRFAERAKALRTKAVVNEDPQERLIRELRNEITRLKNEGCDSKEKGDNTLEDFERILKEKEMEWKETSEEEIRKREMLWEEREANMKHILDKQMKQASSSSGPRRVGLKVLHQGDLENGNSSVRETMASGGKGGIPFLVLVTREEGGVIETRRTIITVGAGRPVRIGRGGGSSKAQDLIIDGIGIAPETAIIWRAEKHVDSGEAQASPILSESSTLFYLSVASSDAILYCNGSIVKFDEAVNAPFDRYTGSKRSEQPGVVPIRHGDRISLGHCACFLVCKSPGGSSVLPFSYNACVREVMLQRTILPGDREYQERLSAFVLSRWRLPLHRSRWESSLLKFIHCTLEANEICSLFGIKIEFCLMISGEVNVSRLNSLRLSDALPHDVAKLYVRGVL